MGSIKKLMSMSQPATKGNQTSRIQVPSEHRPHPHRNLECPISQYFILPYEYINILFSLDIKNHKYF